MTIRIYSNGLYLDVTSLYKKNTASAKKALSMDLERPIGESSFSLQLYDGFMTYDETTFRFKPEAGQRIEWFSDDAANIKLFGGIITSAKPALSGHLKDDLGVKKLLYDISVNDCSELLKYKVISGTFKNFNPGVFIDQLCAVADNRIMFDIDNDAGYTVESLELGEMTYYDAIQEVAKASGLIVWFDENFICHHKLYETILGLSNDEKFFITDEKTKRYLNFSPEDSLEGVVTRVHVVGSTMDAGNKNTQNRKQGKQKREKNIYTKTASREAVNNIRRRLQYDDLIEGTDMEALTVDTPGIIEKTINAQDVYSDSDLELIANAELLRFSSPLVKGSVSYRDSGIVPGKSIAINSSIYDIETVVPVIEVEINSSGGGLDKNGDYIYLYTANFNGPSFITKLKQNAKPLPPKQLKKDVLVKPAPPEIKGHTSIEVDNHIESVSSGITRVNYNE